MSAPDRTGPPTRSGSHPMHQLAKPPQPSLTTHSLHGNQPSHTSDTLDQSTSQHDPAAIHAPMNAIFASGAMPI